MHGTRNEGRANMISVIIPAYNEFESLRPLTVELLQTMRDLGEDFEILFVDDGSTDATREVLRSLAGEFDEVRFIGFRKNCGQTSAMAAGFKCARGNILVTLDADMQNDPADIPGLLEKLEDYDVVCGWRRKRRDSIVRRISSRVANSVRNKLSDEQIVDVGCSLKAYKRECVEQLKLFEGMHRFLPTLVKLEGYRVVEVPVNHRERRMGVSKYGIRNRIMKAFIDLLAVRWMKRRHIRYEIEEEG
ncbi:MAG: glycosyltransferase [Candidatus Abyssobacteria bacterium SURF_5]|uniref:Glycosyltransferase n=1 Tax=Abyssobacteria bacterium (strain SURF_5) TaxID=2093360 RepID=A0A3A4NUI7_ABYX5|nr:MAG: glycosyltransferase [Candidatus Abyssubacteria bacterium SURF_5]